MLRPLTNLLCLFLEVQVLPLALARLDFIRAHCCNFFISSLPPKSVTNCRSKSLPSTPFRAHISKRVVFEMTRLLNSRANPNAHCGRHNRNVLPSGVALMQCSCSLNLGFMFVCYPRKAKELSCPTNSFCYRPQVVAAA